MFSKKIQKNAFSQTSLTNITLPPTVSELEKDWKDEGIQLNKMQAVGQEGHKNQKFRRSISYFSNQIQSISRKSTSNARICKNA